MAAGEKLRGVLIDALGAGEEWLITRPLSLGAGLEEAGAAPGADGRGLVGRGDA